MEMRRRIQETALDLFDREGFENVSVEEIAQAAGCSVGNIYHYFKSKDELAIQLTQHVDEAYQVLEQAYLADTDRSGREKLLDFVGRSLEISVGDEVLYKAFIHGLRYPEQGVLKGSEKRVYYRLLGELVDLCRREGSIRQELITAEVVEELVTLHRGMLFEWRIYEVRYLEPPYDRLQTEQFLREAGLAEPPLVYGTEEDGRLLGYVIYHAYDPDSMELGWVLSPDCWGKGYASRLTDRLVELAHRAGKTAVIECVPEQTVTRHIAEKKGFVYVGRTDGLEVYRLPPNE